MLICGDRNHGDAAMKKPKPVKQSEYLLSRVTPADAKYIKRAAKKRKLTISAYIRQLLIADAGGVLLGAPIDEVAGA
jgi:uncharacterized protein (DUF1778 family)